MSKDTLQKPALEAAKNSKENSNKILKTIDEQETAFVEAKSKAVKKTVLCIPETINRQIIAVFDNQKMPFSQYALVLKSDDGHVSKIHGSFLVKTNFITKKQENEEPSIQTKNMIACPDVGALRNVVSYLTDKGASLAKKILDTDGSTSKLQYVIRGSVMVEIEDINAEHKKGVVKV